MLTGNLICLKKFNNTLDKHYKNFSRVPKIIARNGIPSVIQLVFDVALPTELYRTDLKEVLRNFNESLNFINRLLEK